MKTEIRFISNMVRDLLLLCGNLGMIWPQVFVSNSKCNTSPWVLFCWVQVSIAKAEYNESGFIPKKKKKKNIMSPVKKILLIAAWQRWKVESCKESCIFSLSLPLPLCKKFYLESIFFLTFPRLCSYAFALEIARGGAAWYSEIQKIWLAPIRAWLVYPSRFMPHQMAGYDPFIKNTFNLPCPSLNREKQSNKVPDMYIYNNIHYSQFILQN